MQEKHNNIRGKKVSGDTGAGRHKRQSGETCRGGPTLTRTTLDGCFAQGLCPAVLAAAAADTRPGTSAKYVRYACLKYRLDIPSREKRRFEVHLPALMDIVNTAVYPSTHTSSPGTNMPVTCAVTHFAQGAEG